MKRFLLFLIPLVGFVACSDSSPTDALPETLLFSIVGNPHREGYVGEPLTEPVVVLVEAEGKGRRMQPVEGVVVNFVVTEGGGSVWAGTGVTNQDGLAADFWTLGPEPGNNTLEVRAVTGDGQMHPYGTFTATGIVPNQPPVAGTVTVTDPLRLGTAANCVASGFTDPNGDPLTYEYDWYLNSVLLDDHGNPLPTDAMTPGDLLYCGARAFDGEAYSVWAHSAETLVYPTSRPMPPHPISATAISSTRIDLNWTDTQEFVDSYLIEWLDYDYWVPVATVGAAVRTWSDTHAWPNDLFEYRVRTRTIFGEASSPIEVSAWTPPNAPTALQANWVIFSGVTVSWPRPYGGCGYYHLERSASSSGPWQEITSFTCSVTGEYRDIGGSLGDYYRVRARGPGGYSDYSPIASATGSPLMPF